MKKIRLIFYLSLLGLSEMMAQACIPDITYSGVHTTTYTKSATWIKSSGITTIPTGANVTWDANPLAGVNGYVELNSDFETMPGSEFLAIVQAVCLGGPLPIKLISFNAKAVEDQVILNWVTSSEINAAGFDVERSSPDASVALTPDGGISKAKFDKIGFVKSDANKGNSNEKLTYEFTDKAPQAPGGGAYYRLKLLDLDGKFEYSAIKSVKIESKESINIFPNPTIDFVNIQAFGQKIKSLELLDTRGSVIYQENSIVDKIDLSDKAPGIYFLKIEKMDGKVVVKKVMRN